MKTKTYARLSLLVPFLLWGLLLVYWSVSSSLSAGDAFSDASTPLGDWVGRAIAFYVIGILFWLLPYLLLGSILFMLTFLWERHTLIKVFALSPIAMVILTLAFTNIVTFWEPWGGTLASNPYSNLQDLTFFNLALVVFILIWSYVCVGIGFGVYKLLQHLEIISDEVKREGEPIPTKA